MTTYVLVHGSWGGGWVWSRLAPLLEAAGHRVYSPSLTGLADRHHLLSVDVGLATHIEDVANLLEWERLDDVTLVGHSYGGMVITGVADRVPDRVAGLVYVDAFVPSAGQSCFDLLPWLREPLHALAAPHGGWAAEPIDVAQLGVDDTADVGWLSERATLMPIKTHEEPLPAVERAGDIPTQYVACTRPGLFAETAQAARARGWTVTELDAGHFCHVTEPKLLVDVLLKTDQPPGSKQAIERINPPTLAPPVMNLYAQVVVANGARTVHIAGQVAIDAAGNLVGPGDYEAQARQAFTNLKLALDAAGATPAQLVRNTINVVDHKPELVPVIFGAGREVFGEEWPLAASMLLGVQALGLPEWLIEVEGTAVTD